VPTAALAYSGKTAGVFASVGVEGNVLDARSCPLPTAVPKLLETWRDRDDAPAMRREKLEIACDTARRQIVDILSVLASHQ
jgi:hypothetical protein